MAPGGARATSLRAVLFVHAAVAIYFASWVIFARLNGVPFSTIATDPVSAVQGSLREVQLHPEEGIHALARIQLPPYTGILHISEALAWSAALVLFVRGAAPWSIRIAPIVFSLVMLQEDLFLTSERMGHESVFDVLYLVPFGLSAVVAGARLGRGAIAVFCVFAIWLAVRSAADVITPTPLSSDMLESLADLLLPCLWCAFAAETA